MKRYRFIKRYESYEGAIPEGSEITILEENGGAIYFNGGLVHQAYSNVLKGMVNNEKIRKEYLREENIPYNKV